MGVAQGNAEEEGLIVLALQKFDGGVGYRSIALQAQAQTYLEWCRTSKPRICLSLAGRCQRPVQAVR